MEKQPLRETLIKLQAELDQTRSVDETERELLHGLMRDVQELLERSGEDPSHQHRSLSDRLKDTIQKLEASHPTLTTAMGQVVDALSRMGI